MPKILVVSDLHAEFWKDDKVLYKLAPADMIVVAGDLGTYPWLASSLQVLCERYDDVVFVPGNHEYYQSSFELVDNLLYSLDFPGLHILTAKTGPQVIQGQRFVGDTLWFRRPKNYNPKWYQLNDFHQIIGIDEVYDRNDRAIEFFEDEVDPETIVVSHHFPTPQSIHPLFKSNPLNQYFCCDIEYLIKEETPKMWIHGHTHFSFDYHVGETRIVCNPLGYPNENDSFEYDKIIEV